MAATNSFTETIRALDSPREIDTGDAPMARPLVNAHIHLPPNFTAFETTPQAVELADVQGVRVLGASNYYDYAVYADFAAEAERHGIFPLFGLEIISLIDTLVQAGVRINDPGNPGKMYICGKGITRFDPLSNEAQGLLQTIRDNDSARMVAVTERLAAIFASAGLTSGLDADAIKGRIAKRHQCSRDTVYLQERHLAQAFQEVLFEKVPESDRAALLERAFGGPAKSQPNDAVGIQNDIRSYLMKAGKAAFVPDTFVGFDHAYRLILALGGIPCYPTLADGVAPITQYESDVASLVADLKGRGVVCAEFIPLRNTPEVLSRYVHAVRDAGLFVTAGTEHNTLDLLPIAPICLDDAPIPDDIQEIFWEGACVVAAHQYLTIQGQTGYVDAQGTPNADYAGDDERIKAFHKLGATVIARYQTACAQGD
jgi:hypothetical protein